jgi:26 proteasome complex subunit DSS1
MSNSTQKSELSEQPQQQKPQVLEEDDEFEDFPVEGTATKHLPTETDRH